MECLIGPEAFELNSDHVFFFMNCMGVGEDNELFSSIQDGSAFYKGGIADLNPKSNFFHSELTPYNTLVKSEELVREPTGNVTVEIINGSVTVIPEYIYYYETVYTQEVARPLSSETKLGMIVGQNNDPMTLPLITDSQKESLDDLNFALEFAAGYYLGATFATFYSIIYIPLTFQFSDMRYAVKHALEYTQNPKNIIRDVIGSDKNDCLILESDQTIDPSYYGASNININGDYFHETDANHLDEVYHGDIWSGDGYEYTEYGARGDNVMFGPGSILDIWSSSPANEYGSVVK